MDFDVARPFPDPPLAWVDRRAQERTIKASGRWWGAVAAANGLREVG